MVDPEAPNNGTDSFLTKLEADDDNKLATQTDILARLREVEPKDRPRKELKKAYLAKVALHERQPRFLAARHVATLAAAVLLSSGGAVYAANDAMPDTILYPVKRATETAALSVTSGRTRAHLENVFARKRLREAGYLLGTKTKAAKKSDAIELLEEAREEGDRGLNNKVDELLERVGQDSESRNTPKEESPEQSEEKEAPGRRPEENPGQSQQKEVPGRPEENPGHAGGR